MVKYVQCMSYVLWGALEWLGPRRERDGRRDSLREVELVYLICGISANYTMVYDPQYKVHF